MSADLKRCEVERRDGSFMTLGPRRVIRCENVPKYIVKGQPRVFGSHEPSQLGSMSMCETCFEIYVKIAHPEEYSYVIIKRKK